jgi:hypothetical protein
VILLMRYICYDSYTQLQQTHALDPRDPYTSMLVASEEESFARQAEKP